MNKKTESIFNTENIQNGIYDKRVDAAVKKNPEELKKILQETLQLGAEHIHKSISILERYINRIAKIEFDELDGMDWDKIREEIKETIKLTKDKAIQKFQQTKVSINEDVYGIIAEAELMLDTVHENLLEKVSVMSYDQRFLYNREGEELNGDTIRIEHKNALRFRIKEIAEKLLGDEENFAEECSQIARVFVDINGLKPVNDFAGHGNGDKFLRSVAEIMTNKNKVKGTDNQVYIYAKEMGWDLIPSSEGGDEFGFLIKSKDSVIDDEDLFIFRKKIEDEVSKINMDSVFDFKDPEVRKKIKEADLKIPDDYENDGIAFHFKPSVATGQVVFDEAAILLTQDKFKDEEGSIPFDEYKKEHKYKDSRTALIHYFMKAVFDISEKPADDEKREHKEKWGNSTDPEEVFMAMIMQRNKEAQELLKENKKLKEDLSNLHLSSGDEIEELKRITSNLESALEMTKNYSGTLSNVASKTEEDLAGSERKIEILATRLSSVQTENVELKEREYKNITESARKDVVLKEQVEELSRLRAEIEKLKTKN